MSRGAGIWERRILEATEQNEWTTLYDLLPADHTHAQLSAIVRAANQLRRKGMIVFGWGQRTRGQKPRTRVKKRAEGEAIQKWYKDP